jgi:hypothetical protein
MERGSDQKYTFNTIYINIQDTLVGFRNISQNYK